METTIGFWVVVSSNWQPKDNSNGTEVLESNKGEQYSGISVYNKTIFGTKLFLFKITQQSDFSNVAIFLERTNLDGHIQDVENIYVLPNMAINENGLTSHTAYIEDIPFTFKTMPYSMNITSFNTEITKRTSFTGFSPKNNKCFVFPYNYLFVTNNQGTNNIYKYEDFTTAKCVFENQFSIAIGGSGRLLPKNYKNMATCDDESLALGKYPTCAWSSDAFTNWLTQNSVNIATSVALGVGGLMMSALTFGATAAPTATAAVGFAR